MYTIFLFLIFTFVSLPNIYASNPQDFIECEDIPGEIKISIAEYHFNATDFPTLIHGKLVSKAWCAFFNQPGLYLPHIQDKELSAHIQKHVNLLTPILLQHVCYTDQLLQEQHAANRTTKGLSMLHALPLTDTFINQEFIGFLAAWRDYHIVALLFLAAKEDRKQYQEPLILAMKVVNAGPVREYADEMLNLLEDPYFEDQRQIPAIIDLRSDIIKANLRKIQTEVKDAILQLLVHNDQLSEFFPEKVLSQMNSILERIMETSENGQVTYGTPQIVECFPAIKAHVQKLQVCLTNKQDILFHSISAIKG